ncbi:hypothetical protein EZV62_003165 [Acer yangbiense]|uniref:Uncharacterized protein n=1 Tax=Acer yangbiense TaxID=1000413 RepID=A0A5C7IFZ0_9ROSI|nr:hypothetical protein EZV62_003165 [Acer yangbiense]
MPNRLKSTTPTKMSCSRAEHTTEYLKPTQLFRETMKRTYYMPSAAFTLDCVPVSPHIYHRSTKCRTFFTQILNRAEHQIEYLKPSQLFHETLKRKRDYENPVFLGFSFSKDYAIVTISYYTISRTSIYSEFERDTTLLDKLAEVVRKVKDDPNYGLLGIVIEDNNSIDIHNLMDNLCKKGNFESLKYTCWKHDIESENSAWDRSALGSLFCRETFYYEHERLEVISAENMLLSFVDFCHALYEDEDLEREDKDLEMEDKDEREDRDLEREDSKRKIEYLKPSQFFRETTKRDYQNPVFLGFSFSTEYAIVTISNYPISRARIYREFPIDTTFLGNLTDVVRSVKNDVEKYDLVGIIIDNNKSVDIHNLMDNLCKKGNFKSLKYTCWKNDIGSKNSIYDSLYFSAELMLQKRGASITINFDIERVGAFLDAFNILQREKDEEMEDKEEESEDFDSE